jgi:hypothetical protein
LCIAEVEGRDSYDKISDQSSEDSSTTYSDDLEGSTKKSSEDGSSTYSEGSNDDGDSEDCSVTDSEGADAIRDITTSDFRDIIDHLSVYRKDGGLGIDTGMTTTIWPKWARKVQGVRLHGIDFESMEYTALSFPQDHPFTTNLRPDEVGKAVGLRLKSYHSPLGKKNETHLSSETLPLNPLTGALYMIAKAPFPFQPTTEAGYSINVFFAQEDGKDLSVEHLATLIKMITDQLVAAFSTEERISFTPQGYLSAWNKYKEDKGLPSTLPSPFEI